MGNLERALDAPTIAEMDQDEAFAMDRLREFVRMQKVLHLNCGVTSPLFLSGMITNSAEALGGQPDLLVLRLSDVVAAAANVLVQLGWPENESLPVAG